MWEQQHELGTQKMYSLAPSLTICFSSSLEGRRQHMWMVHAIGRRQQAQARWATRHTPALPKGTARTTGLRAMKSHHTTTFPALLARCLVKSVYSNSSRPVHRYGLELCNFSKGCIIPFILVL